MYEHHHHQGLSAGGGDYPPNPQGNDPSWFQSGALPPPSSWGPSYAPKKPLQEEEDEAALLREEGGETSSDEGYDTGNSPSSNGLEEKESLKRLGNGEEEGNPNLMWLLDFKLDFFNDQPPQLPSALHSEAVLTAKESDKEEEEDGESPSGSEEDSSRPLESSIPNKIYAKTSKKPPYTYTELITQALKDKTALTVSGIYQWIMDRYLFFKAEDDRWKNSVRHNLSMNPHFRKGSKSKHGAGHLWVLADYEEDPPVSVVLASEALESSSTEEDEAAKAVKSILDSEEQKIAAAVAAAAASDAPLSPSHPQHHSEHQGCKRGKRKRGFSGSLEEETSSSSRRDYSPSSISFQKTEGSLIQRESYVVQDVTPHGQDVFIAETNSMTSLLESGSKRLFLELRPDSHHTILSSTEVPPQVTTNSSGGSLHENVHPPRSSGGLHSSLGLTNVASNVEISTHHIPFSPMEDMEELGVAGYCYEEDVTSLENALGFDFHQKQLLAK